MNRNAALWALAAACGIFMAAGISWATSRLTSQHIGLSSEPLGAGRRLAPPAAEKAAAPEVSRTSSHTRSTATKPSSTAPSTSVGGTVTTTQSEPAAAAEQRTKTGDGAVGGSGSQGSREDRNGGASSESRPAAGRDD